MKFVNVVSNSSGSVGIGTSDPPARLYVTGSYDASQTSVILKGGFSSPLGGAGILDVQNSGGSSIFFVSGSGNVGIGTNTATSRLFVTGSSDYIEDIVTLRAGSTPQHVFRVRSPDGSIIFNALASTSNWGKVGIGTDAQIGFHVHDRMSVNSLEAWGSVAQFTQYPSAGNTNGVGLIFAAYSSATASNRAFFMSSLQTGGGAMAGLALNAWTSSTIDPGPVSIGTLTNFSASLTVSGSQTSTRPTTVIRGGIASPSGALLDVQSNLGASLFVISGSGNVGIGDSTPGNKLSVGGTAAVTGSILPGANQTHSLGAANNRWLTVFANNLTGSLTTLSDGSPYLVAGNNVTITTGSLGQVTIAASAAANTITGTGTTNYVSKFTGTNSIANSNIFDNGTSVGIGTTSPTSALLTVSGTIVTKYDNGLESYVNTGNYSAGTTGFYPVYATFTRLGIYGSNDTVVKYGSGGNNFAVFHGTVPVITANSSDNVSVGPGSFAARLYVSGSGTSSTPTMVVKEGTIPANAIGAFDVQNYLGTSLFFVSGSGNVGISETSPTSRLHVSGQSNQWATQITSVVTAGQSYGIRMDAGTNSSDAAIQIRERLSGVTTFYLRGDGNLGLNNSNPASRLFVSGSSAASTPTMTVKEGVVSPTGGAGVLDVQNSAGTSLLFVSGSGRVGIGVTTPNASLDILSPVPGASEIRSSGNNVYQVFRRSTNTTVGYIGSGASLVSSGGSNSDFGIAAPSAGTNLILVTGATERLRVDSSGNVGIGTTLMDSKLVVDGNSVFSGSVNPDGDLTRDLGSSTKRWKNIYAVNISGSLTGSNLTTGQVVVTGTGGLISGSNNFWWDNSTGFVGIGTSSPSYKLDVTGAGLNRIRVLSTDGQANLTVQGATFGQLENTVGDFYITVGPANAMILRTSTTERLRISSIGNVGIGTNSFSSRLYISGSSTASTPTMIVKEGVATPTGGVGVFDVQNAAGNSLLFVSGSGNIGVGTNNPAYKLEIRGGQTGIVSDTSPQLTIDTVGNSVDSALILRSRDGSGFSLRSQITQSSSTGALTINNDVGSNGTARGIVLQTAGIERVRIDSSGNVGIGTTNTNGNRVAISGGNLSVSGSVTPGDNGISYDLGSTSYKWRNLYASNISGSLTGSNVTAGQVVVAGTGGVLSGSNNFWWDNSTGRVGIGTSASLAERLNVNGNISVTNVVNAAGTIGIQPAAGSNVSLSTSGTGTSIVSGLYHTTPQTISVAVGTDSWIRLATVPNLCDLKLHVKISSTNTEESINVGVKGNYYNVNTKIDVDRVTYAERLREVWVDQPTANGGNKIIYVRVRSSSFSPTVTWWLYDSTTAFTTIHNDDMTATPPSAGVSVVLSTSVNTQQLTNANIIVSGSSSNPSVGIGINNPSARLHINAQSGTEIARFGQSASSGNISFYYNTTTAAGYIGNGSNTLTGAGTTDLVVRSEGALLLASNGNTRAVTVDTSQNVGIGSATPATRLDVNSSAAAPVKIGGTHAQATLIHITNNSLNKYVGIDSTGNFKLLGNSGFGADLVTIADNGNVGIGTTSTTARLLISGSSTATTPTMIVREGVVSPLGGVGVFDVQNSANTSLFFVSGSGNIGIGTTSNLLGRVHLNAGNLYIDGTAGAFSTATYNNSAYSRIVFDNDYSDVARGPNRITLYDVGNWMAGFGIHAATMAYYSGDNHSWYRMTSTTPSLRMTLDSSGVLAPGSNNTQDIGTSGTRWRDLYARSGSFSGDLTISGDLTVMGTSSIINSEIVNIKDNAILLNAGPSPLNFGGVYVADNTANTTGSIIWDASTDRWKAGFVNQEINLVTTGSTDNLYNKTIPITGADLNNISGGTTGGVGYFDGSTNLKSTVAGTSGQILQSAGTSAPTWVNFGSLVSGSNVVTGSGTTNYVSKFISGNAIGNSTIFDNGTNVGIGTTSPERKLTVQAGQIYVSGSGAYYQVGPDSADSENRKISFHFNNNNTTNQYWTGIYVNTNSGFMSVGGGSSLNLYFDSGNSANFGSHIFRKVGWDGANRTFTEVMRIDSSGNVGIGTNGTNGNRVAISGGNLSVTGSILPGQDNSHDLGSISPQYRWRNLYALNVTGNLTGSNLTAGQVVLAGTGGLLSGSNNFWWDNANGRVGIGTSNLSYDLVIGGNVGNVNRNIFIQDFGYGLLLSAGNGVSKIQSRGTSMSLEFQAGNGNDGNYWFSSTGRVGIGTTTGIVARFTVTGSTTTTVPTMVLREAVAMANNVALADFQNSSGTSVLFVSGSGVVGIGTTGAFGSNARLNIQLQGTSPSLYSTPTNAALLIDCGTSTAGGMSLIGGGDTGYYFTNSSFAQDAGIELKTRVMNFRVGNSSQLTINKDGVVAPTVDNAQLLGQPALRWREIYVVNLYASNISGSLTGSNLTAGQVVVTGTGGVLSGSNNFWWENSTNRVGIGTSSPAYKLTVQEELAGALSLGVSNSSTNSAASSRLVLDAQGGTWNIENIRVGGILSFKFNTSEALRITNANNVGIGTTNVLARLHVSGSSTASDQTVLIRGGTPSQTGPVFEVEDYLNNTLLIVSGSGNVGVGTILPSTTLHVLSPNSEAVRVASTGTNMYLDFRASSTSQRGFLGTGAALIGGTTANDFALCSVGASGNLILGTGVTTAERLRITPSGDVGIGTATYAARFHVSGSTTATSSTVVARSGLFAPSSAILDVQDNIGTSMFWVSGSSGTSSVFVKDNLYIGPGTTRGLISADVMGNLYYTASSTNVHYFASNSVYRMVVGSNGVSINNGSTQAGSGMGLVVASGNVGIGTTTTNGSAKLEVNSGGSSAPLVNIYSTQSSYTANLDLATLALGSFETANTGIPVVTFKGVNESNSSSANGALVISTRLTSVVAEKMRINSSGHVTPGTDNSQDLGSASLRWRNLYATSISGSITGSNVAAGQVVVGGTGGVLSGSNNFWWSNSNNRVGINTSNPGFTLEVNGDFAASTKSFVIPHPLKPGWKLRYGSLEGPENGVYCRGKSQSEVIDLPDYWVPLVEEASITVQITPVGKWQSLYVESVENNQIKIGRGWFMRLFRIKPKYFYTVSAARKDSTFQVEYSPIG